MPPPVLVPLPLCHRCSRNVSVPRMNIREVNKWSCGLEAPLGSGWLLQTVTFLLLSLNLDHLVPLSLRSAVHKHTHTVMFMVTP